MQLSESEIQNTLDLLREKQTMAEQAAGATMFSVEEIRGILRIIRRISGAMSIRRDRVDKVKRALESSTYNVSSDEVASELIGRTISDKLT